jgi:hypothetical protein
LEQLLVVRNAVFAVDEAVTEGLLAIVLDGRNEAIPGSCSLLRVCIGSQAFDKVKEESGESN